MGQISGTVIVSANLRSAFLWRKVGSVQISTRRVHINPLFFFLYISSINGPSVVPNSLFPTSHRAPNTLFKMGIVSFITGFVAPIFIIISPITSYADQTYSIHRTKSSAGFSLDITLIMLVASMLRCAGNSGFPNQVILTNICRVFYYPGARFDVALLIQAFIMIVIQLVLLKVALDHRPAPSSKGGEASIPFAGARDREFEIPRPYNFWQWRSHKP